MQPSRVEIFLDANAGLPLSPKLLEAAQKVFRDAAFCVANPSSLHEPGRTARKLINQARLAVAQSLSGLSSQSHQVRAFPEKRVFFTSSGTEANQWVLRSCFDATPDPASTWQWLLSAAEHESLSSVITYWQARGVRVAVIPVNSDGRLELSALEEQLQEGSSRGVRTLVSALWVHNETGVIQDVARISECVRSARGLLHLDGAQAWGKIPLDSARDCADFVTFSGCKIGAFAGTGVLWCRAPHEHLTALFGGKQESGYRGGTENLLGIFSLGKAAELVEEKLNQVGKTQDSRDALEKALMGSLPGLSVAGSQTARAANTSLFLIAGIQSQKLVQILDRKGISCSVGSACSSGQAEPSESLLAMGYSREQAMGALRLSLLEPLTEVQQSWILEQIRTGVQMLRGSDFLNSNRIAAMSNKPHPYFPITQTETPADDASSNDR